MKENNNQGVQRRDIAALVIFWVVWLIFSWGCADRPYRHPDALPEAPLALSAESWPEADGLFKRDPRWMGADDAYSVDLGAGRVLWLFGDSFVSNRPVSNRAEAVVIRNSVAIQQGYNPASAQIRFFWSGSEDRPAAFFPSEGSRWFWPGDGVKVGDCLLIFLLAVLPSDHALGFDPAGWRAVRIDNPQAPPSDWQPKPARLPENDRGMIIGVGSVFEADGWVVTFGYETATQAVYLVRWPAKEAALGDLTRMQWWCGTGNGWQGPENDATAPVPLFMAGQMEFTVDPIPALKRHVAVQTIGFGKATVGFRTAASLTGPWSPLVPFYKPDMPTGNDILVYAAKGHPHLSGADLVLTYATNSLNWQRLLETDALYYPRFVRVRWLQ